MNYQTKPRETAGMILWQRLERLRIDLEASWQAFDELYSYVAKLKAGAGPLEKTGEKRRSHND